MMSANRGGARAARVGVEALVIFASVAAALMADDWRQNRADREEARSSLEVVERDLLRDSAQVAAALRQSSAQENATEWLLAHWGGDADADTLVAHIQTLRSGPRPSFSRAGFEGLRSSNGLRLLRDREIRDLLIHYYEVEQLSFDEWHSDIALPLRQELASRFEPHLVTHRVYRGEGLALRSSWSEVNNDLGVEAALSRYYGVIQFAIELLEGPIPDEAPVRPLRGALYDLLAAVRAEVDRD